MQVSARVFWCMTVQCWLCINKRSIGSGHDAIRSADMLLCFAGGPAVEYPAGCQWQADTEATPYPGRTGGVINNPLSDCSAANTGCTVCCSDRYGDNITYVFDAEAGANYVVSYTASFLQNQQPI